MEAEAEKEEAWLEPTLTHQQLPGWCNKKRRGRMDGATPVSWSYEIEGLVGLGRIYGSAVISQEKGKEGRAVLIAPFKEWLKSLGFFCPFPFLAAQVLLLIDIFQFGTRPSVLAALKTATVQHICSRRKLEKKLDFPHNGRRKKKFEEKIFLPVRKECPLCWGKWCRMVFTFLLPIQAGYTFPLFSVLCPISLPSPHQRQIVSIIP